MSVERGPWERRHLSDFNPFSPLSWFNKPAPHYSWMVEGVFAAGTVGMISGDGGLGKSLLCQQLCTAACLGHAWLGLPTAHARSLAVFCEEDRDELHRRQEKINAHYGCTMSELEGMLVEPRAGRDSVLVEFPRWGDVGYRLTDLYRQIESTAAEHGAQFIILDTIADIFAGNEVDRSQARAFVRELRKLALRQGGVVLLTQHPSLAGLADGSGRSGSTGWSNSVRTRLYLTHPAHKKSEEPLPNERLLRTPKSNYGPPGGRIPLHWERGVFVRAEDTPPRSRDWADLD